MKKTQTGFTLIELMIVVAIIGILAAIALPKFADMLEKSREGATKGNYTAIRSALNIYVSDQGGFYPTVLTAVHAAGGMDANFINKYLEKIPSVKVTAKSDVNGANQGGGPGAGTEAVTSAVTQKFGIFATAWNKPGWSAGGKGWRYDSNEGTLWVNSNLVDMANLSYTTYGY